jgi:hypothetical protein
MADMADEGGDDSIQNFASSYIYMEEKKNFSLTLPHVVGPPVLYDRVLT